ncbi:aminofutalosine synthase MqnE [Streptomyces sp. ZYX-F-203]
MDVGLRRELEEKVGAGVRLTREDGIALYGSDDLAWLGGLGHRARARKNGDAALFDVGTLAGPPRDDDSRPGPPRPDPRSAGEPRAALAGLSPRALSAAEIHRVETVSGADASEILDELIESGLESLTAGGAEIFDEEVRRRLGVHATPWEDWSRIHRLAHDKGLWTVCGMLHGRVEEPGHRVDHVLRLREAQDASGGFRVFAPLPRRQDTWGASGDTAADALGARVRPATGAEILKAVAVSRLLLDNVPHLRVSWAIHGAHTTQLALRHGADDIAGTVADHDGASEVDGASPEPTRDDLLDAIRDAGLRPVERDGRYAVIREYAGPDPARRDAPQPMRV